MTYIVILTGYYFKWLNDKGIRVMEQSKSESVKQNIYARFQSRPIQWFPTEQTIFNTVNTRPLVPY